MNTCERCGIELCSKQSLLRHLKKEKICDAIVKDIPVDSIIEKITKKNYNETTYDCSYCEKKFNHCSAKSRHMKTCKAREHNSDDKITSMQTEINQLKDMIKNIQPQTMTNCTINNTTNIQNNIQQNNTINFGKENVEFLADSFIRRCLFRAPDGVSDLTKKIHFNPDKPEYHNVTTTNKKDGFLEVFKDGKWFYDDKNKVLDALIKQSFDIISSHYDQFEDEIRSELSPTNFKRVDRFVESVWNQDKTIQNSLRKCLYLLILNNRHMVDKE
jgi:polyribonucleotide nucleotidyltransferase